MSVKTITELKEEISLLPDEYKQALGKQTHFYLETSRLEQEISKVEKSLLSDQEENVPEVFDEEEEDGTLLDLEAKYNQLKYDLTVTEYKVEIRVRDGEKKRNESPIKALIGTNDEVCRLKKQVLSDEATMKAKKSELRKLSRERREKRPPYRRPRITPESQELDELQAKLFTATSEHTLASDEVDAIKFKFETYRVLYGLESLEEIE